MGGCSMNIVHTLQTLERVNIYKCFHRRGVSLEGDPIARSRQVEAKQPTAMKTNNKKKNKKQKQKTARQCHLLSF